MRATDDNMEATLRARRDSTPSRRSSSRRDRSNRKTRHAVEDDSPEPASEHHRRHNSLEQGAIVIEGVRTLNFFAVREKLFNCSGRSLKRTNTTASNTTTNTTTAMASAGGKWREEQILIICPGSRTTMAQLGCSELTPPTHRFPTRMFKDGDEWRPYYTYQRKRVVDGVEKEEWVEDVDEDEGATWPIQGGQIVNMDAFLAFLDHVHSMLTTTYHNTPIMLMASPQWTRPDCEAIAQYIFEKTRTPALCMINSAIATQYGLKFPNMTVVDIGYEKVDVTAIYDGRVVNHLDLGPPRFDDQISGGEVFTRKLMKLLEGKNFNRDMAEQLKKSPICEVLPYAPNAKSLVDLPKETGVAQPVAEPEKLVEVPESNEAPKPPAATNSTEAENGEQNGDDDGVLDVASIVTSGQTREFLAKKEKEKSKPGRKPKDKEGDAAPSKAPRLPNSKRTHNTFFYEEVVQEIVNPEPKEKPATNGSAEKPSEPTPAGQTTDGQTAPATAPAATTTEDAMDVDSKAAAPADAPAAETAPEAAKPEAAAESKPEGAVEPKTEGEAEPNPEVVAEPKPEAAAESIPEAAAESKPEAQPEPAVPNDTPEYRPKRVRRDIDIGLERFTFAERSEIDRIVTTIYRTIQGVDDMYMRPACWDNLVFVGNGSRLRGLKENILQTLNARHLVSPSTATMFTSELPSNMATPTGTGSQTPTGSFTGAPHQLPSSGVNPLLQAATTASTLGVAAVGTPQPGSDAAGPTTTHHFHSQTPTSIKTVGLPTYLQEWTKNGFEESMFLGAQVAARIVFCLHSNMDIQSVEAQRQANLSRIDYK
ncbi:unnamed protein product [Clonostachys chloroleuca]|uniref:SWI/SNF and RSC complexes subunit arp9 n=1 Tax=Clonostachys chloroleuca TaxID=1926264 RepID=A0AA35M3N9_9HYPO|nr:unnamed protein product [Clonostachys chloroleuca]